MSHVEVNLGVFESTVLIENRDHVLARPEFSFEFRGREGTV
jgi:hypothetical protein